MRKINGYTLAEVLIAVGIVGIIAAVAMPMFNKLKPDASKALYLKTYDTVVEMVKTSVANPAIWAPMGKISGYDVDFTAAPLRNTEAINLNGNSISSGNGKFCQVLGRSLGVKGTLNCSNALPPTSFSSLDFDKNKSFTTPRNVDFMVYTASVEENYYHSDIYFDVNGAGGNNCFYDRTSCPEPDRFKLFVAADGTIVAADPMGKQYLATRANWKKRDYKIAKDETMSFNIGKDLGDLDYKQILSMTEATTPEIVEESGNNSGNTNITNNTNNNENSNLSSK